MIWLAGTSPYSVATRVDSSGSLVSASPMVGPLSPLPRKNHAPPPAAARSTTTSTAMPAMSRPLPPLRGGAGGVPAAAGCGAGAGVAATGSGTGAGSGVAATGSGAGAGGAAAIGSGAGKSPGICADGSHSGILACQTRSAGVRRPSVAKSTSCFQVYGPPCHSEPPPLRPTCQPSFMLAATRSSPRFPRGSCAHRMRRERCAQASRPPYR